MDTLLIAALIGPASCTLGMFVGAWLTHRIRQGSSPVPDVVRAAKSIIDVVFRRKVAKEPRVKMKNMRA